MDERPITVNLLGATPYARRLVYLIDRNPHLKLGCCYDDDRSAIAELQAVRPVAVAETLDEALADPSVPAVVIASASQLHPDLIIAAAEARKHIYVTRPLAVYLPAARLAISSVRDAGVILQVAHCERRQNCIAKLSEILSSGRIGRPVLVEATTGPGPDADARPPGTRFAQQPPPGGPLIPHGVVLFDTLAYLFGPIEEVSARWTAVAPQDRQPNAVAAVMSFEQGGLGCIGVTPLATSRHTLIAHGSHGRAELEEHRVTVRTRSTTSGAERVEEMLVEPNDAGQEDLTGFARNVAAGSQGEVSGPTALRALAAAWATIDSAQHHRPVRPRELIEIDHPT